MSKFFYNRAKTKICAKKPFIVIESKILATHTKKVNRRPYRLVKNTPHFIPWFEWEHFTQLRYNWEWKAQNLRGKWRKWSRKRSCKNFRLDRALMSHKQLTMHSNLLKLIFWDIWCTLLVKITIKKCHFIALSVMVFRVSVVCFLFMLYFTNFRCSKEIQTVMVLSDTNWAPLSEHIPFAS